MQFGLTSLLIYVTALSVLLGINVPTERVVEEDLVLPCLLVGFEGVPRGYEGRIPGQVSGATMSEPAVKSAKPPQEMLARNVRVSRGWPVEIHAVGGFLYELDDGSNWIGVSESPSTTDWGRLSWFAILVNSFVVLLPAMVLDRMVRWMRTRRLGVPFFEVFYLLLFFVVAIVGVVVWPF